MHLYEPNSKLFSIDKVLEFYYLSCNSDDLIGVEIELFCVDRNTKQPLQFWSERGMAAILQKFCIRFNYSKEGEHENIFDLKRDNEFISLEPGGQIEYSSPPCKTIFEINTNIQIFLNELYTITKEIGEIDVISRGVYFPSPEGQIEQIPKERYRILRNYLTQKADCAEQMMNRTSSIHVNVDYSSERNAMDIFRAIMNVAPVASAIFTNSIYQTKEKRYQAYRKEIWNHTDPERCGLLIDFIKEEKGFLDYIYSLLCIPVIYISRNGHWLYIGGEINFLQFMKYGYKGCFPEMQDYFLHVNTTFHEARIKSYIEIRGIDAQPMDRLLSPAYFWKGLLIDETMIGKTLQLFDTIPKEAILQSYNIVPELGLEAKIAGNTIKLLASELLKLALEGLTRSNEFYSVDQFKNLGINDPSKISIQ